MDKPKTLRYFIYLRRSQDDKNRQVLSIEAQNRELREFANKENLKVVGIFEESQSAYKPGRPIFNQMVNRVEQGEANALLVWKPDRIARNAKDGGTIIQLLDDGKLQEIRTPFEQFRTEDNRMMLYVHFGMSNDYSRQISANVKRGNRQKYVRGEFVGGAPIGYLNVKLGNTKNIAPDPERALLIKKVFEQFATGNYSLAKLCRIINNAWGLKTRRGNKISKSHLQTILTNTAYYGVYRHGGDYHQGSYEPIISKSLFDKVQAVLKSRSRPKPLTHEFAYTGLMKCGTCGCVITAEEKHKFYKRTNRHATYVYYHCTHRRGNCKEPPITLEDLEKQFDRAIAEITIDKEVWELGIQLLKKKYEEEAKFQNGIRKQWQKEFEQIQNNLNRLLKMRMDEEITAEEYLNQKRGLLDEQARIKDKLRDNEEGVRTWLELAEEFFNTAYQAREMLNSDDLLAKRQAIASVGYNLILKDKKVQFRFKEPYGVLLQPAYRQNVLRG